MPREKLALVATDPCAVPTDGCASQDWDWHCCHAAERRLETRCPRDCFHDQAKAAARIPTVTRRSARVVSASWRASDEPS